MNNLTTRKIVLGMLMVLVLAFSVQGIADALTFNTTTRTGDLQTVLPGDDFTITFSRNPQQEQYSHKRWGSIPISIQCRR